MNSIPLRNPRLLILAVLGLGLAACGTSAKAMDTRASGFLDETKKGDRTVERYDLNGDGVADMEKVLFVSTDTQGREVRMLIEKRLDLDYNGRYDLLAKYDGGGDLVSEEVDLDFDGRFDARNLYEDGRLKEQHLAPGFDGRVAVWKYFNKDGQLTKKARDTSQNGQPDTWEYYSDQRLIRVGYDRDGDGKPEFFEDSEVLQ